MGRFTTLLFAEPSVLEGVARIVDLGGTLTEFNGSPNGDVADVRAIGSDWYAIGSDLCCALGTADGEAAQDEDCIER